MTDRHGIVVDRLNRTVYTITIPFPFAIEYAAWHTIKIRRVKVR